MPIAQRQPTETKMTQLKISQVPGFAAYMAALLEEDKIDDRLNPHTHTNEETGEEWLVVGTWDDDDSVQVQVVLREDGIHMMNLWETIVFKVARNTKDLMAIHRVLRATEDQISESLA